MLIRSITGIVFLLIRSISAIRVPAATPVVPLPQKNLCQYLFANNKLSQKIILIRSICVICVPQLRQQPKKKPR
jgi:hypothetical protein